MKKYILILAIATVAIFTACKKESITPTVSDKLTPAVVAYSHSGLGDNCNSVPTGTHIQLPSHISIVGQIVAAAPGSKSGLYLFKSAAATPYILKDKGEFTPVGAGDIGINITFNNSSSNGISFTLPGGLLFIDDTITQDDTTRIPPQHCLLLKDVQVTVPAGGTTKIQVLTFCANHHNSSPYGITYTFGPVSNYPGLVELVGIMKNKQYPVTNVGGVQTCVWDITNENGLTAADRSFLSTLQ